MLPQLRSLAAEGFPSRGGEGKRIAVWSDGIVLARNLPTTAKGNLLG
jgi:hypothetical protein